MVLLVVDPSLNAIAFEVPSGWTGQSGVSAFPTQSPWCFPSYLYPYSLHRQALASYRLVLINIFLSLLAR